MTSFDPNTVENVFFHLRNPKTGRKHWVMLKDCRIEGIELNREVEEAHRSVSFPDDMYAYIPAPVVKTNFTISGSTLETEIGVEGTKYILVEEPHGYQP